MRRRVMAAALLSTALLSTALLSTALLLGGCASSSPVRFFVLDRIAPTSDSPKSAGPPLQIAVVHMPATLDRRQMVSEDAPNRLTISENNRWGAPLPEMTRRILNQDLESRLAPGRLALPEQPVLAGTSSVSVNILQFGPGAGGAVVLDGTWSVVPSGADMAAASHHFQLKHPFVPGDYSGQARVMSVLLARLADAIAHESNTSQR